MKTLTELENKSYNISIEIALKEGAALSAKRALNKLKSDKSIIDKEISILKSGFEPGDFVKSPYGYGLVERVITVNKNYNTRIYDLKAVIRLVKADGTPLKYLKFIDVFLQNTILIRRCKIG